MKSKWVIMVKLQNAIQIVMEESARGCGEEQLNRVQRYYDLADKYNLQLVAGTYVKVPWSGRATEEDLCRNSKCLGFPFPDGNVRPGD